MDNPPKGVHNKSDSVYIYSGWNWGTFKDTLSGVLWFSQKCVLILFGEMN